MAPPDRESTGGSRPTCPLQPASEFRMQPPTKGVSKQLHTTTWGPRDPTPRTCHAGPPTTLAPATRTNIRTSVPAPPPSRQHPNKHPWTCRTKCGGLAHTHGGKPREHFFPPDPLGPGRLTGVYHVSTRLYSWDAARATRGNRCHIWDTHFSHVKELLFKDLSSQS